MKLLLVFSLALILLLQGCSTIRPPAPSPTPLPIPPYSITVPQYNHLKAESTDCVNYVCKTAVGKPVLIVTESRLNSTTFDKRGIPATLPECPITEVTFDQNSLYLDKRIVDAPDFTNYFVLRYFVPVKKGKFSIKVKNSCQLRGNTFTLTAS